MGRPDAVRPGESRGALRGRLRLKDVRPGVLFVPFPHGYWDTPSGVGPDEKTPPRAANKTTLSAWDPASGQPLFKTAAAAVAPVASGVTGHPAGAGRSRWAR
ncbi:molybdopterin dinucleotide binding domain-containing protein [Streptomyces sp. NPDC002324]